MISKNFVSLFERKFVFEFREIHFFIFNYRKQFKLARKNFNVHYVHEL